MGILEEWQKKYDSCAYLYAIMSTVFLVIMQFQMKILLQVFNPFHLICLRGFFLLLINIVVIYNQALPLYFKEPSVFKLLLQRSILSGINFICFFGPMSYNSISMTNSIINLAPIFTHFLEAWMYQKSIDKTHFLLTGFCFVGVLLVIQPSIIFHSDIKIENQLFLIFPFIAAVTGAFGNVLLHKLKGKIHALSTLQYFYVSQILISGLCSNIIPPKIVTQLFTVKYAFLVVGFVVVSYFGQNCLIRSYLLKKPSVLMPFSYLLIINGLLIDIFFFKESFNFLSIIGMCLTSSGLFIKLILKQ